MRRTFSFSFNPSRFELYCSSSSFNKNENALEFYVDQSHCDLADETSIEPYVSCDTRGVVW